MTAIASLVAGPSGAVELRWQDGRAQRWTAGFLRSQCRCAECKARTRQGQEAIMPIPTLSVTEIRPVGAYGVQFIFSDGHDRGIYPWVHLEQLIDAASRDTKEKTNEKAA